MFKSYLHSPGLYQSIRFQHPLTQSEKSPTTLQRHLMSHDAKNELSQGTNTELKLPEGFETLLAEANSKLGWNSSSQSLYRIASQKCPNMLLMASWRVYNTSFRHTVYFYNSSVTPTDFGYCCSIYPYLDFDVNNGSDVWHDLTPDGSEDSKFKSESSSTSTENNNFVFRGRIPGDPSRPILEWSEQRALPDA